MIDPEQRQEIKETCDATIMLLRSYLDITTSHAVQTKILSGISKMESFVKKLDEEKLTEEDVIDIGDAIKSAGEDLIAYGLIIMPPKNTN